MRDLELRNVEYLINIKPQRTLTPELKDRILRNLHLFEPIGVGEMFRKAVCIATILKKF